MPGFESTALELVAVPECPPGPVSPAAPVALVGQRESPSMVRQTIGVAAGAELVVGVLTGTGTAAELNAAGATAVLWSVAS